MTRAGPPAVVVVVVRVLRDGRGGRGHAAGRSAAVAAVASTRAPTVGRAHSQAAYVLLGVKENDVHLGREQAAQRHPSRQRDRHAQRQRLHLQMTGGHRGVK